MTNIAELLKSEIARIARREVRKETKALASVVRQQKAKIVALQKQLASVQKERKTSQRKLLATEPAQTPLVVPRRRIGQFRPDGLKRLRAEHKISAAVLSKILGVTVQSIYNWESGKTRPNTTQMEKISILTNMGKREFRSRLASMDIA